MSAGTKSWEEKHKPVFKDICLFTIKTISQRQPDRAIFMRSRRRLEGCCQLLLTRKGSGDCILSQDQGEGKKNKSREVYKPLKCFNQRKAELKVVLETFSVFPCTPGLSVPLALGGEQGEEGR